MLNTYNMICKASTIKRWNGKSLSTPHNIVEHMYRVQHLGLMIALSYNSKNPDKTISIESVMVKAAVHDLPEVYTGDIPSPIKKHSTYGKDMKTILTKIEEDLFENDFLDGLPEFVKSYYLKNFKEEKSKESGEVIKIADRIEALMTCCHEVKKGNYEMHKSFNNILNSFFGDLKELVNKFPESQEFINFALELVKSLDNDTYSHHPDEWPTVKMAS